MFGRRSQDDFNAEIRSHLQLEIDRLRAQGMSAEEAERTARRNFGNVGAAEDRFYHGQRGWRVEDAMRDVRHSWRALLRTPGFLVTSVVTLALAMGAVAGMFSVVNAVLLQPLPYPDPDRLVGVLGTAPGSDMPEMFNVGPEFYLHYKDRAQTLDGIFAFGDGTSTLRTDHRVERIQMCWPSNDMYATLGVRPQLGRLPLPEDENNVVLISDTLWATWFNRNPAVVGQRHFVSDEVKEIIGVMPPDFAFPTEQTLLWVANPVREDQVRPGVGGTGLVARLRKGVSIEQAAAELTTLAREIPARFNSPAPFARLIEKHRAIVLPAREAMVGPSTRQSLWVLLGAVGVVLLIACANVANLFLVRTESRRHDLILRSAIGASRTQLVRLQMAEAFVVALVAGVFATMLSVVTLPLFLRAAPPDIPRLSQAGLDLTTLLATFGLVVFVALACGIVPALRASAPDLTGLRDGGRGATTGRMWARDLLVVAQTALGLVLLIDSALLYQSLQRLRQVDPGYEVNDIYTFQFAPDQPNLQDGPSLGQMHLTMMDRIRALPGVTAVGVVNNLPLDEGTGGLGVRTEGMSDEEGGTRLSMNFSGGDHFQVLGIELLRGRAFTNAEAVTPNNSVILSRSAADKLWPGQDPIGRILRPQWPGADTLAFSVVGVVEDVKQNNWRDPGQAVLYLPLTGPSAENWGMGSPAYVVKSARADALGPEIRELVRQIAPEAPVYREYTMEFLARRSMNELTFTMLTLGVVSALALFLGAVGLYGVLSYAVAQRTREIGVRMALGATARAVRRQVVSQGAKVVLVGVVLGVGTALASTRLLGSLLFEVKAVDPLVFSAMSITMIGMGVAASYMPARRASAVDPLVALRAD